MDDATWLYHLARRVLALVSGRDQRSGSRRYNAVSPEAYRGFGFPSADDLGNMFQFKRDFESYFTGARDPVVARALKPGLQIL